MREGLAFHYYFDFELVAMHSILYKSPSKGFWQYFIRAVAFTAAKSDELAPA